MKSRLKYVRLPLLELLLVGILATPAGLAGEELTTGLASGTGKEPTTVDPSREVPFSARAAVEPSGGTQSPTKTRTDGTSGARGRTALNQTGCMICLTGSASVQWSGSSGSFHVDTVSNNDTTATGALQLSIVLTASMPTFGQNLDPHSHYFSNLVPLSPLAAGYHYSNVNSGTIPFWGNVIPAGEYFTLLYLEENYSGTYYYDDWIVMNGKVSCNGSTCSVITPPTPPTANFSFSANPKAGQAVQFTDTSTGSPTSWSWNFGDGGSSTAENPTHTFGAAGTYQVSLTASNSGGPNTKAQSVVVSSAGGGGGTCVEDSYTACLIGGRYKVTGRWKNQYAGGAAANLFKTKLTDTTNAFWIADANTYEFVIRINTATDNGRAWITVLTFTSVEFWVNVVDTKGMQQSFEYHSAPGNTTLIYDPSLFVYP